MAEHDSSPNNENSLPRVNDERYVASNLYDFLSSAENKRR